MKLLIPPDGQLLLLQHPLHGLLCQQVDVALNALAGGLIHLAQAAGASLFFRHLCRTAQSPDRDGYIGAVQKLPRSRTENRPGLNSAAPGVIQQFLTNAVWEAYDFLRAFAPAAAYTQHPGIGRLHSKPAQILNREIGVAKYLY